jgi:hypothetical protein
VCGGTRMHGSEGGGEETTGRQGRHRRLAADPARWTRSGTLLLSLRMRWPQVRILHACNEPQLRQRVSIARATPSARLPSQCGFPDLTRATLGPESCACRLYEGGPVVKGGMSDF